MINASNYTTNKYHQHLPPQHRTNSISLSINIFSSNCVSSMYQYFICNIVQHSHKITQPIHQVLKNIAQFSFNRFKTYCMKETRI